LGSFTASLSLSRSLKSLEYPLYNLFLFDSIEFTSAAKLFSYSNFIAFISLLSRRIFDAKFTLLSFFTRRLAINHNSLPLRWLFVLGKTELSLVLRLNLSHNFYVFLKDLLFINIDDSLLSSYLVNDFFIVPKDNFYYD